MNPFTIHFFPSNNTVKVTSNCLQFKKHFISFYESIREQSFDSYDSRLYWYQVSKVYSSFLSRNIYVTQELYDIISKYCHDFKIKVQIREELCVLACYLLGYKKSLIRQRDLLSREYNECQKYIKSYKSLINEAAKGLYSRDSLLKKNCKQELPKNYVPFFVNGEAVNEYLIKLKEDFIKSYRERTAFFRSDDKFLINFRRYVSISLLAYLKDYVKIKTIKKNAKTSREHTKIIALIYYLLSLKLPEKEKTLKAFFEYEEKLPAYSSIIPYDVIYKDLGTYGKSIP